MLSIGALAWPALGQTQPKIKVKKNYTYYENIDEHVLTEEQHFDREGQVVERRSYSMSYGQADLRRAYKYQEDTTTELAYTSDLGNTLSFKKITFDSAGFTIKETKSFQANGKDIKQFKREIYLPDGQQIVEPNRYWFSASSFLHRFVSGNDRLISFIGKEWNEKGKLINHLYWHTELYKNWVKKASNKYLLNKKTGKMELVESVTFSQYGFITSRVRYKDGEPISYKYLNANQITFKQRDSWYDYNSRTIGRITDSTFIAKGSEEKPIVVVKMQIIEKLDSNVKYFQTLKSEYLYEYDQKGKLTKTSVKRNDSIKVLQIFEREYDGSLCRKSYDYSSQRLTSNYYFGPGGQLLGYEQFDEDGNTTNKVRNQYKDDKQIGSVEERFGNHRFAENLKFKYLVKNDTLYNWKWRSMGKAPLELVDYSIKFNPYDKEIETEDYFPILTHYCTDNGYSKQYYKTEYNYNSENTCTGYSSFKGTDSNQMQPSRQVIYEFGNEKVENAFTTPNGFSISRWEPRYYMSATKHYPTLSKTVKERKDKQWQITFLANKQSTAAYNEWSVKEISSTTGKLELDDYIKVGIDTLTWKADSLPNYYKTKEYRVEYNSATQKNDTSYFSINTHNAKHQVVNRVYYQYKERGLDTPRASHTTTYSYDAQGSIISEQQFENGVLQRSYRFEYEYYE
ncbi:MAG: hypothetical protein ACPGLV_00235 [Bacteroidia bacterium]